eukprot:5770345-Prymnesium_polylepis.1
MSCMLVMAIRVAPQIGPQCAVGSGGSGLSPTGTRASSDIASMGMSGGVSGIADCCAVATLDFFAGV